MFRHFTSHHCINSSNNVIGRITTTSAADSVLTTQFLQPLNIARFLSTNNVSNLQNFTVDYLTNSCGLSPQSALKASERLLLKSTSGPDSVLSLFKSYGFTMPQISRIVRLKPLLLLAKPDKSLKPKLEYLSNVGISGRDLAKVISTTPLILETSLDNKIIPSINYLRSLVGTDEGVAAILKNSWSWQLLRDMQRIMRPNIAILLNNGVPQCNITKFLMLYPNSLYRNADLFNKTVLQVVSMGFFPSSMMFLYGLHVLSAMSKPKWDEKLAVYLSFSWAEDEVLSVFKKQPFFIGVSGKKISLALDFLMNSLNWTREDIATNSTVIQLSLEKRLIPRCHVLQILLSKNLITKSGMAQGVTENVFLEKYVTKFHNEVPDLMNMYQSNRVHKSC